MKYILSIVMLVIVAIALNAQSLVFVTQDKPDFPNVMGEGLQFPATNPGVSVELVRLLEKELKLAIEIKRFPWARCLETELKNGTADGAFIASYKKEREEFGKYPTNADGSVDTSKRVTTLSYSFFKLKNNAWTWDGKTLTGLSGSVGVPGGYSIADDLTKMGATVIANGSTELNFRNLLAGRLALVATIDEDGDYILKKPEFVGKIEKITTPIVSKPYYVMLSKQFVSKNPDLAAKIWNAVATLREKHYLKISEAYF